MNWKQQEQMLLEKMKSYGLERKVIHTIIEGKDDKGTTTIFLFPKSLWQNKKSRKDDTIDGHIVYGDAKCSLSEHHYSRRIGRVIAMDRAIKNYEKTLITG